MDVSKLEKIINDAWENRDTISTDTKGEVRKSVEEALNGLDSGLFRVAEPIGDHQWKVNQWLKKAVLLSFRLNDMGLISGAPETPSLGKSFWWDKIPSKFAGYTEQDYRKAGFRSVPGCVVRHSAYIAKGVVLMPCFVNIGANVGESTMVDTWATVGSCAQIGANVHLSGGVGIGGVLEPLQAGPVIIEDDCFIGARSEVVEGVIVEKGAVLSMGVFIGASTKIIDRSTGEIHIGRVPAYSVVVPGSLPGKNLPDGSPGPNLYCAVIVKKVDAQTREKTSINDLLRDYPDDPWLHELHGQILFESGQIFKSINSYTQAVSLAPRESLLRLGLARAQIETGKVIYLKDAVKNLKLATNLESNYAPHWHFLGVALGRIEKYALADLAFAEASVLRGSLDKAMHHAIRAEKLLPPHLPSAQRARDITNLIRNTKD